MTQPPLVAPARNPVRRWLLWTHMVCGLTLAVYAVVLGLTGSVLVFREELAALTYPEFHSPGLARPGSVTPDQVLAATGKAFPDWRAVSLTWPNADTPHWMVYLIRGSESREAYLAAETADIIGSRDVNGDWIGWLLRMHVNFHAGPTGRLVNGFGAIGLLGLCVTGTILWWPPRRQFASRFRIHLSAGWRRLAWQLHHATGMIALVFIMILAFTGGYYIWLQDYIKVVDRFFERSTDPVAKHQPGSALLPLAELARITAETFPGRPLYRTSIPALNQVVRITVLESRPQQFHRVSSVALDPVTGKALQVANLDQRPAGNSILSWFSVLHFGRFGGDGFGFYGIKIGWALLALSLPLLAISGCLMWWRRVVEPRLRPAIPRSSPDRKVEVAL